MSFSERIFVEFLELEFVAREFEAIHGGANFGGRKFRAPVGVVHREFARAAENLMIHGERGADGKAGIACSGLDEDALERRRVENFSIGDAIEGHAAGQAQSSSGA